LRDIGAILAAAPMLLTTPGPFSIPTLSGNGMWIGRSANLHEEDGTMVAALHCRTYRRD
jgi:hypothetical protein